LELQLWLTELVFLRLLLLLEKVLLLSVLVFLELLLSELELLLLLNLHHSLHC